MGFPVISDLNLGSEGHCFFCLIPVKVKQGVLATPQFQKESLHFLARYLGMDIGKVISDDGQVDPILLTKVRKSRLKAELCEKCTSLNNNFSVLYRQLEKLEIEIKCSLKLINQELLSANLSDKRVKRLNSPMGNELSEIVDVLLEEAIQKFSQKFRVAVPRVEIEKLTKKQIDAEIFRPQTNSGNTEMKLEDLFSVKMSEFPENIVTEQEPANKDLDDDHRNYDIDTEAMDDELADTTEGVDNYLKTAAENNSPVIVSSASTNKPGKMRHVINPETGKWKCSACPLELTTQAGIQFHYQSFHQKIRYRCAPCGKDFAHRSDYNRHHRSVHVGVKFKCLVCNKLFPRKDTLRVHQRVADCGNGSGLL